MGLGLSSDQVEEGKMLSDLNGFGSWRRVWCRSWARSEGLDRAAALEARRWRWRGTAGARGRGGSVPAGGRNSVMGWEEYNFRAKGGPSNG
jgi:hypothetical protein